MKKVVVLVALLLLSGCAVRNTKVVFEQDSSDGGTSVLVLKADGSTLTTDQDATGDLPSFSEMVAGWLKEAKNYAEGPDVSDIESWLDDSNTQESSDKFKEID